MALLSCVLPVESQKSNRFPSLLPIFVFFIQAHSVPAEMADWICKSHVLFSTLVVFSPKCAFPFVCSPDRLRIL